MVAHIKTVAFLGVDAVLVDVKAHFAPGNNVFIVAGLPDKSVAENRERARAAQMSRQNCLNEHLEGEGFISLPRRILPDKICSTASPVPKLSARGFDRILRVARKLADLDHRNTPSARNIATTTRWRDVTV